MTDDAFLAAIRAAPHDALGRLVYADWLDERGDVRGEYLRLRAALQNKRYAGRGRDAARLDELESDLDPDWVWRAFPVPKLAITGFTPALAPVTDTVTKFGGQPVWLTRPEWPVSRSHAGRRMQFVCQVAIPDICGVRNAVMAYLFLSHCRPDETVMGDNWFFETDANDPDSGENAVVLQPGGARLRVPFTREPTGPTLFTDAGEPCELLPQFEAGVDPPFDVFARAAETPMRYFDAVCGEKVGGTPVFGNGNDDVVERLTRSPDWRHLLQLTTRDTRPHHLNLGVNTGYVFVRADGRRGVFLTE